MKQNLQVHISEPCHEDWNKMTTTDQGRYCQSCCKQVVDFTIMSDAQIMEYLSNTAQKTCGRFNSEQLDRPLQKNKRVMKKYWKWLMASAASLFFFFDKASAQKQQCTTTKGRVVQAKTDTIPKQTLGAPIQMMGDVAVDTTKTQPYKRMGKIAVYPTKDKNVPKGNKKGKKK